MIDYLQLMTGGPQAAKGGNREQEVSFISRTLKAIAKGSTSRSSPFRS